MTDTSLQSELRLLDAAIRATGAGVMDNLAPGLPADVIREQLEALGLTPPDELVAWFEWQDGLLSRDVPEGQSTLTAYAPFSLGEAVRDRESLDIEQRTGSSPKPGYPSASPVAPIDLLSTAPHRQERKRQSASSTQALRLANTQRY